MHEYVKKNFVNVDQKQMLGKFTRPKTTDHFLHPSINNNDEFYNSNPLLQNYIRDYKDPSLGPRHMEKVYHYNKEVK